MTLPEVGIFARTFPRATAAEVAAAVACAGFTLTQFNFSAIGSPTLAPDISADTITAVGQAFRAANVRIWGLSATYNIISTDRASLARHTHQARRLIGLSPLLGVTTVTLCTGTRSSDSMWTGHPDNHSAAAWRDMRTTLDDLLETAAAAGIKLGIEPEPANVINSAPAARRLLDELGPDAHHIGIVLDPGNLVTTQTLHDQHNILDEAFHLLGEHIIGLHAKDLSAAGPAPLGCGDLDYATICDRACQLNPPVPITIQDATESDAARSGQYLRRHLNADHP
jgi:sugar phosphate isomerase/epimerase